MRRVWWLFVWFVAAMMVLAGCRGQAPASPQVTPSPTAAGAPVVPSPTPSPSATPTPAATATPGGATATPSPTFPPTATWVPTPEILGTLPAEGARRIDRTWNILFLGSDRRANSKRRDWRTDAIMLIMIDKETGEVAIVSIPRDLYIEIPGYKEERINAADYIGERGPLKSGPELLRRIFRKYFNVRIDNYIRLDLPGLQQIFEVLGPVEMCFPQEEVLRYQGKTYRFGPGVQQVDPEALYIYMTKRAGKDDLDRIRRQHRALLALRKRARDLNLLPKVPALYRALSQHVQTDLSLLELLWLARFAMDLPMSKVHSFSLDYKYVQPYTTKDGQRVLLVRDWNAVRKALERVFEAPPPDYKPAAACP